jgi:hypothetical protein
MTKEHGNFHSGTTIIMQDIMYFFFEKETIVVLRIEVPPLFFIRRKVFNNGLTDLK